MIEEKIGYIDAGEENGAACAVVGDGLVAVRILNIAKLVDYLLSHELDIACDEDDYGDLHGVFIDIIGYPPNGNELTAE